MRRDANGTDERDANIRMRTNDTNNTNLVIMCIIGMICFIRMNSYIGIATPFNFVE